MHQDIVNQWNQVVPNEATVYHVGDLSFLKSKTAEDQKPLYDILNRLNGDIVFLKGNHDYSKNWKHHQTAIESGLLRNGLTFENSPYKEIRIKLNGRNKKIVMCHYPIVSWNNVHHGSFLVHGHSHNSLTLDLGKAIDVGFDALYENYSMCYPISIEDVVDIMAQKSINTFDHHDPSNPD